MGDLLCWEFVRDSRRILLRWDTASIATEETKPINTIPASRKLTENNGDAAATNATSSSTTMEDNDDGTTRLVRSSGIMAHANSVVVDCRACTSHNACAVCMNASIDCEYLQRLLLIHELVRC